MKFNILLVLLCACVATSADIQDLATEQRKANETISVAVKSAQAGQITPAELGKVVVQATDARAKVTEEKVAVAEAKMTKLQESVLAWWQVLMLAAGASIPVVKGGMMLLDRKRDKTREAEVAAAVEAALKARNLT